MHHSLLNTPKYGNSPVLCLKSKVGLMKGNARIALSITQLKWEHAQQLLIALELNIMDSLLQTSASWIRLFPLTD